MALAETTPDGPRLDFYENFHVILPTPFVLSPRTCEEIEENLYEISFYDYISCSLTYA
jgi:hypothetical protein